MRDSAFADSTESGSRKNFFGAAHFFAALCLLFFIRSFIIMKLIRPFLLLSLFSIIFTSGVFAQSTGSLAGTVTDANGAVVVGATVTIVPAAGPQKMFIANAKG